MNCYDDYIYNKTYNMSKVIRLTESDLVRIVKRVISESELNEFGTSDFGSIRPLGCVPSKSGLKVGISTASTKGDDKSHYMVVYYTKKGKDVVYGHGPKIQNSMDKDKKCDMGKKLIDEFYSDYKKEKDND